ncbi:2OG-Fe(II) oxygenase family protein [Pararoseomonas indoligenes]|uniref:2OG-Fe(II) oxygenase n=1 Tax=Roseomonas indoligenes TaxID=2820811 RepID=A0A940S802_9PROT|nr:2OG-Fe(II) oxygenase [Pararoseomonas indoligenes]MBP0493602.1 2OG-Fe(II) oxygenase [Pararoseomonas indoligenes]
MSDRSVFLVGDHLPGIVLPDASGQGFDVMGQVIAGRPRVLALGGLPEEEAPALESAARAAGTVLVEVLAGAPDGTVRPGPQRVFDAGGGAFRALGLAGGGVAVVSPRGRLEFAAPAGPAGMASAVRAALAALPSPAPAPPVRRGGAPVLLVPDILEPELVAALLAHWERGEKQKDRVAGAAEAAGAHRIKRRADVFLDDRGLYETFHARLMRRVLPEMMRAYRFQPVSYEVPRIGCYDAADAGAFEAHRDNRTPFTAHRRFAMSLNLNTGEYEGGTLRFPEFGPDLHEPEAGGAAIFGCDMLHEALPVTRGRRFAIFTFFTDAEGAKQEQALIRQRAAAGQQGIQMR